MLLKCLVMILSMDQIGFVVFSSKMDQQPSQVVCCYIHGSYQNILHSHPPQHLLCFIHTNVHTQLLEV
jgi:hypothetical protein